MAAKNNVGSQFPSVLHDASSSIGSRAFPLGLVAACLLDIERDSRDSLATR